MGFADPDNIQSGSYHIALLDIPSDSDADAAYSALTNSIFHTYNSKTSKALLVHESTLRYIHRFLVFSYSGCNETRLPSKDKTILLWCMHSDYKVYKLLATIEFRRQHNLAPKKQEE
ncbi:hypothetical protein PVK06_048636 [Gossypium arboreum]|uniref:Uncharacterized protein n=1 Tax=Gossypium arboreum TaxID=29729 RepID=A0ABR0MGH0_GOSAR|nr:hypothetical protein PVK06_048636 [Gossypium arboreum]